MRIRSLIVILGFFFASATHAATRLLAPVYPGAMHDRSADDDHYRFFFTRDSIEQVRAYYAAQGLALADGAGGGRDRTQGLCIRTVPPDMVNRCYARVLMAQGRVARYLKDVTLAYDAGLVIQARERKPATPVPPPAPSGDAAWDAYQARVAAAQAQLQAEAGSIAVEAGFKPGELAVVNGMSDLFDGLKDTVGAGYGHSSTRLINIYRQYRHLETAEYPYARTDDGRFIPYDRWLLARDRAAFDGPGDHWNDWIGFLKDLDAHAYRTAIVIPVDPESWGGKR